MVRQINGILIKELFLKLLLNILLLLLLLLVCIKNNKVQKDKITKQENFGYK